MALKKNNEDLFVKRFSLFYYIHSQKPCSCLFVNMCIMEIASLTNRNYSVFFLPEMQTFRYSSVHHQLIVKKL